MFDFHYIHFPIQKVISWGEENEAISASKIAELKEQTASTKPALLRDLTSVKTGYKPMAQENRVFLPLVEVLKKLLKPHSSEVPLVLEELDRFHSRIQ